MTRKEVLNEMAQEDPNDPFLLYAQALEDAKEGNINDAIETLDGLTLDHPNYLASYYQLGKLYEEIADLDAAIKVYKKGIKLAKSQNEQKTAQELGDALFLVESDDE